MCVQERDRDLVLHIEFKKVFLLGGGLVHFLLCAMVGLACVFELHCGEILPSVSYVAGYRLYDKLFCLALTAGGGLLALFTGCLFAYNDLVLGTVDSICCLAMGLGVALALPFLGVFDEINSTWFISLEKVHLVLVFSVFALGVLWVVFSLEAYYWKHRENPKSLFRTRLLLGYLLVLALALYSAFRQWRANYSEAIAEYVAVSLLIYLPYVFSLTFRTLTLELNIYSANKTASILD